MNSNKKLLLYVVYAVLILLIPEIVGTVGGNYWVRVLDFAMLYVMLALGLNVVVGFTGLLDLGYIAFYAVGAYTAALLSSPHLPTHFEWIAHALPGGMHTPYLVIGIIGMALAAFFGILLGAPTLRLRGDYLAIVTLGFGEIVRIFMNNLYSPINFTNGPQGVNNIDPVHFGMFSLDKDHSLFGFTVTGSMQYYYLFLAGSLLVIAVCTRLQSSRIGRAWAAIREDELAAKAMGINTRNMKLLAFAMGASFGGLAGSMFGAFQGFVSPESFTFWESTVVLACVVLGGMGHIPGVILGALLMSIFPEVLRVTVGPLQQSLFGHEFISPAIIRQGVYGIAMVVIMLYRPAGLWPAPKHEDRIAKLNKQNGKQAAA